MSFQNFNDDKLVKRMRYIADKLVNIREQIEPLIKEYDALSPELLDIMDELDKRGLDTSNATKTS